MRGGLLKAIEMARGGKVLHPSAFQDNRNLIARYVDKITARGTLRWAGSNPADLARQTPCWPVNCSWSGGGVAHSHRMTRGRRAETADDACGWYSVGQFRSVGLRSTNSSRNIKPRWRRQTSGFGEVTGVNFGDDIPGYEAANRTRRATMRFKLISCRKTS